MFKKKKLFNNYLIDFQFKQIKFPLWFLVFQGGYGEFLWVGACSFIFFTLFSSIIYYQILCLIIQRKENKRFTANIRIYRISTKFIPQASPSPYRIILYITPSSNTLSLTFNDKALQVPWYFGDASLGSSLLPLQIKKLTI